MYGCYCYVLQIRMGKKPDHLNFLRPELGTSTSVCVQVYTVCVQVYTVCLQFEYTDPGPGSFFSFKNSILYEIQLLDELQLVVGSFEPPDARAACHGICRHFEYGSYLLKVW
jgi:hypothetical protein